MVEIFAIAFVAVVSLALAAALCLCALWLMVSWPLHFLFWTIVAAIVAVACDIGAGIFAVVRHFKGRTTGATHES